MEIDHIYICTEAKAPSGNVLKEFGLVEGSSNVHEGQGTANRRFYFHNFMLELLWVENLEEVKNDRTKPMRLYERCLAATDTISPFGIAFRPTMGQEEIASFSVWDYNPIYLPDFLKIQIADNTPLSEPMYFYLFFGTRQDGNPSLKREPMEHRVPLKEVTSVKIHVNQQCALSESACIINHLNALSIDQDKEHFIELEFDHGVLNQSKDFRPDLPLVISW